MRKIITSLENKQVKRWVKLQKKKYRDSYNEFIIEGFHLISEAQKSGLISEIITTDEKNIGTLIPKYIMDKISTTPTNQGIIAICKKIPPKAIGRRVIVLKQLQDPGNVGSIIRTACAMGFSDIIVDGVDIYNDKVIRASQGAIFKINVLQSNDYWEILDNHQLIGAVVNKKAQSLIDFVPKEPFAIFFGNEGQGLDRATQNRIGHQIYIPIKFESLNVAAAAAIILFYYQQ